MKCRQIPKPKLLYRFPMAAMVVLFLVMLAGCGHSPQREGMGSDGLVKNDSSTFVNWVNLKIKFMPATNTDMRELSIREIKKLITDTVIQMRGVHQGFSPTFVVTNKAVDDTLSYTLDVKFASNYSQSDTSVIKIGVPKCPDPCRNGCAVCAMLTQHIFNNPTGPVSREYIESISNPVEDYK